MTNDFDTLDLGPTEGGEIVLAHRYRVVRELGRGGMGTVYLAEDIKLDNRQVAIKTPPAVLARNKRAVAALKREAKLAMALSCGVFAVTAIVSASSVFVMFLVPSSWLVLGGAVPVSIVTVSSICIAGCGGLPGPERRNMIALILLFLAIGFALVTGQRGHY